jgi:riboflavin synthase
MFTGLISEVAVLMRIEKRGKVAFIRVDAPKNAHEITIGDSVAINGVCLTAVDKQFSEIMFDVSSETLISSNLTGLKNSDRVNVELALKASDRLGGHFVLGHVDCTGVVVSVAKPLKDMDGCLKISIPEAESPLLIDKGSIAVNGVSLTIQRHEKGTFQTIVIPHTWTCTNFGYLKQGDIVNIEFDLLVKTVIRSLKGIIPPDQGISFDKLSEWGY